jgi:hypothetical protein
MNDKILDRMEEQLNELLGPKPVTIDDVTFIDGDIPKVTILNNTERLLRSIKVMTEFEKLKKQNSAYIVFRHLNTKKDIGNELTKEEQDFVNEYLNLN